MLDSWMQKGSMDRSPLPSSLLPLRCLHLHLHLHPAGLLYGPAWYPPGYVKLLDTQLRQGAAHIGNTQQQQQQQYTWRQLVTLLVDAPRGDNGQGG